MDFCQAVSAQFFDEFYVNRINSVKNTDLQTSIALDLAITKFWCSVIDFYGGGYFILAKQVSRTSMGELKNYNWQAP